MNMPKVRDSSGNFTRWLHPLSCSIHDSLQPLSTVNMVLPPEDEINNLDWVEVPVPDGSVMYCRVESLSTDAVTGQKSIYLEHGACLFDDILIPESSGVASLSWKTTISAILTNIINKQPSGQTFRWTKGTVQATDTIYIEPGGMSLMTAVMTMMESIPGYQVEFVQASASDWHIDIKQRPTTVSCEGRLSRNLRSCNVDYSTSGIVTRVYCEGINTAGYMESSNKSTYGLHEETMSVNDGLTQEQRQSIVQAYLDAHDHPAVSISISALELSQLTGVTFDRFKKGTLCRIVIPWLGLTVNEVIVDKSYGDVYGSPEEVTISLANTAPDLSIAIANITGGGGGGGGGAKVKQNERFATKFEQTKEYFRLLATDSEWDAMGNSKINVYSQITQTASSIQSVVSRTGYTGSAFFDSSASYVVGDIVMYKGKMYRFNVAHQGDWSDSDVTQVTNLYSTITQTEAGLRAEVSRATESEGNITSALDLKADSASLSTVLDDNGNVTAASITTAINNGSSEAIIEAEHIELKGEAVAASLASEDVVVTLLSANTVATDNLNALAYLDNPIGWRTFTVDGTELANFIGSDDINFNIADTQTYRSGVSAVINSLTVASGDTPAEADVKVSSSNPRMSNAKTLTIAADGWVAVGTNTVRIKDGNTSLASVAVQMPGMSGEWTGSTGSSATTSNTYKVNEKVGSTIIGAATGHQVNVCLTQGTRSGNTLPIYIRAESTTGTIVAKDTVTVSGGGGTVDSIAINGTVTDGTTSTAVKLNVPVSAYDAQDQVLKSATLTPVVPPSIYTPTLEKVGNSWRSTSDGTASNTGNYMAIKVKATTAGGLGSDEDTYVGYIGGYLRDERAAGAAEGEASVTLSRQTWSDQSIPSGAPYVYTIAPGHNRKFTVNASNGQSLTGYFKGGSDTITVSDWKRTAFTSSTTDYVKEARTLQIPVSVKVNGTKYSCTFTTGGFKVVKRDSAHYMIYCGDTQLGVWQP